jgi:hypothetical protein
MLRSFNWQIVIDVSKHFSVIIYSVEQPKKRRRSDKYRYITYERMTGIANELEWRFALVGALMFVWIIN